MKHLFGSVALVALVALAAAGPAIAADVPVKAPVYKAPTAAPIYNWTGWYVGLNAGGAWGSSDVVTVALDDGVAFAPQSITSIAANGRATIHPSGFIGGVQGGYNWQAGNMVAGVEADFNYFGTEASRSVTVTYPTAQSDTYTINQEVKTHWLFTARPRFGFANNNWLFYLTGGLAVTELKYNNTFTDTFFRLLVNGSVSKTKAGWTIGGGVEHALLNAWSVKAEYLYVDFGSVSSTAASRIDETFSHSADLKSHIVRAGVNYRFDWGKGPVAGKGPVVTRY